MDACPFPFLFPGVGYSRTKSIFHISFFISHFSLKTETAKSPRAAEDAKPRRTVQRPASKVQRLCFRIAPPPDAVRISVGCHKLGERSSGIGLWTVLPVLASSAALGDLAVSFLPIKNEK